MVSLVMSAGSLAAWDKRPFIGIDTEAGLYLGALQGDSSTLFSVHADVARISLIFSWDPGAFFIRFRGGAVFLPNGVFALQAGLGVPIWELIGQNGNPLLGFQAFMDAAFPFEPATRIDMSGGALFFFTPNLVGLALGLRWSSRQGFLPFIAYSGAYRAGKYTGKGVSQ